MPGPHYRYDLRSQAVDAKRDREVKQKWGPTPDATRADVMAEKKRMNGLPKAARRQLKAEAENALPTYWSKRDRTRYARHRAQHQKVDMLGDPRDNPHDEITSGEGSNDTSTDEGTPAPDADIMYSYDAPTGPNTGDKRLQELMAVAESRFEETQTVKLVNNEYDMVDRDGDESVGDSEQRHIVDDDYEML